MNVSPPYRIEFGKGVLVLEGDFEIKLGDRPVGKVTVTREGLYYHFFCRCRKTGDSVCKVWAKDVSIGVLVPKGDGFFLDTRLPVKRFAEDHWDFQIQPSRPVLEGRFVPIKPEEPFAYLTRLKDAHLLRQNGQVGILIKEKAGT